MGDLNKLKQKIANGEPVVGTNISFSDSSISEMIGWIGYDFLWVDSEHTALDKKDILQHIIAAKGTEAVVFVRVPWNDPVLVKPILEMGVDGIIFPFIKTVEDAERAVHSCIYPPEGIRGFGPIRALRYGMTDTLDYIRSSTESVWKILQIEHIECVKNLPDILKVKGIDAFVIGPMDLSGSLGILGQMNHQDLKSTLDKITSLVAASGIPLGVGSSHDPEVIREWINRGVNWIAVGGDCELLCSAAQQTYQETKALFKK